MSPSWLDRLSSGLSRTREQLGSRISAVVRGGPDVSPAFWDDLEAVLLASDLGWMVTEDLVSRLKASARREDLADADALLGRLAELLAAEFTVQDPDPLAESPVTVLFVGVNGTGKTTSVGKIAAEAAAAGRSVLVGSGDTYRAAAVEQLRVWCERAGVRVIERERGSDPAAVAFDTLTAARESDADLVLIDTAGRLHTSRDLMSEHTKVQRVARAQSVFPVRSLLVIDATTGQNGLAQARAFNDALDLDGIVLTKLDGTAKGGIAVAISRELALPIVRVGVGETIDDLLPFAAGEFAAALAGR
jgi:fused signal recognition particle receptor